MAAFAITFARMTSPLYRFAAPLIVAPLIAAVALSACNSQGATGANIPGDAGSTAPYQGIAPDEELHFTGTEPFWGGQVRETQLIYTTPENQGGQAITVERFAGRGGIAYSGLLDGSAFDLVVTEGQCSDGMSDRTYPFTVTLHIGADERRGCAWSQQHPFSGPESP